MEFETDCPFRLWDPVKAIPQWQKGQYHNDPVFRIWPCSMTNQYYKVFMLYVSPFKYSVVGHLA